MSTNLQCKSFLFIILGLCQLILTVTQRTQTSQNSQDYRTKIFDYFRNETYPARQIVNEIPKEAWDMFERNVFEGGSKQKLQDLLTSGGNNLPERVQSLIRDAVISKLTNGERIDRLRTTTSEYEIFKICELIPRPSTWTKDNITRNWTFLKKCPTALLSQITDKEAVELLVTNLQREQDMKYKLLGAQIFFKQNGEPSTWTEETFKTIKLSEDILPYICMEIKDNILVTRQRDILSQITRLSSADREPCIEKLIEGVGLKAASTASEASSKVNELRQIQGDLMPNDFHRDVLMDSNIASILDANVKRKLEEGYLRPDGALRVLYAFGNASEVTSEIIRTQGICALSLALPSQLLTASVKKLYSPSDIATIVKCINNYKGPGADEKFGILAERVLNESDTRRSLTVSQYPAEILKEYGYDEWIKVDPSEAKQILSKPTNGTPQDLGRLIDMITKAELSSVNPFVREILPYYLYNEIASSDAPRLVTGVQPGSVIALKAAEKFMEGQNMILGSSDVSKLQAILPYIGGSQASRFDQRYIMDIFKAMGANAKLTMPAAAMLQNKFENFTTNISRSYQNNAIAFLSGYDTENIPISVICAFSPTEISRLTTAQKMVLLKRLGMAEEIDFRCPRTVRLVIVMEGCNSMGSSGGIQPADVEIIGNALPDAPAAAIQNAHKMAKARIIKKLNDMIDMKRVKPCWSDSQRSAVAQIIKDVYGSDLSSWNSIHPFRCILYTFKESDLEMIRSEVLASESCESRNLFPSDLGLQAICNGSLGAYEYMRMKMAETNFIELQRKAAAKIIEGIYDTKGKNESGQKMNTNMVVNRTCDKASYGGANVFTEEELRNIQKDALVSCVGKLGRYPIEQSKAEILARKLVDYSLIRGRPTDSFIEMKYIWKGLPSQTISQSLEDWTAPYDINLIDMIGKLTFSDQQVRSFATKLRREMGFDLSSQNATEYQMINQIICGFDTTYLNQLNATAVRDSLPGLSQMANCSNPEALKQLFKAVQKSVGSIDKWKASDMMQFGVIFAGIQPEDWQSVNVMEMEGVSPLAVRQFSNNTIKAMNATHIEHMSPYALAAFTDEQKRSFSSTMMQALESSSKYTQKNNNGASIIEIQTYLMILVLFLTLVDY